MTLTWSFILKVVDPQHLDSKRQFNPLKLMTLARLTFLKVVYPYMPSKLKRCSRKMEVQEACICFFKNKFLLAKNLKYWHFYLCKFPQEKCDHENKVMSITFPTLLPSRVPCDFDQNTLCLDYIIWTDFG